MNFQAKRTIRRQLRDAALPGIRAFKETQAPLKLQEIPLIGHGAYVVAQFALDRIAVALEDAVTRN